MCSGSASDRQWELPDPLYRCHWQKHISRKNTGDYKGERLWWVKISTRFSKNVDNIHKFKVWKGVHYFAILIAHDKNKRVQPLPSSFVWWHYVWRKKWKYINFLDNLSYLFCWKLHLVFMNVFHFVRTRCFGKKFRKHTRLSAEIVKVKCKNDVIAKDSSLVECRFAKGMRDCVHKKDLKLSTTITV